MVARARAGGDLPPELLAAAVTLVEEWAPDPAPSWVTAVPSRRRPGLVPGAAGAIAAALDLPLVTCLERRSDGPPQHEAHNSAQQVRNVLDAFAVAAAVPPGPVLLVDDLCDSRWTLTVVARLLRTAGAGPVLPLVLTKVGG